MSRIQRCRSVVAVAAGTLALAGLTALAPSSAAFAGGGCAAGFTPAGDGVTCLATFSFTGSEQYVTVPADVTSVAVTANGAQGSDGLATGGDGGTESAAQVPVTPGDQLDVIAGGTDGYGGGGTTNFGTGGGGSFVFDSAGGAGGSQTLLIAAGGGGGGGAATGDDGGTGGGTSGAAGVELNPGTQAATGGSQSAGGLGGFDNSPGDCNAYGNGNEDGTGPAATDESLGSGGSADSLTTLDQAGAGGGGFYGGGAGCGDGGGGGGSGYAVAGAIGVVSSAVVTGNGSVTVSYLPSIATLKTIHYGTSQAFDISTSGGDEILVCGENLDAATSVTVGDTPAAVVSDVAGTGLVTPHGTENGCAVGDFLVIADAPPGSPSTATVTVTTPLGTTFPAEQKLTYLPTVTGITLFNGSSCTASPGTAKIAVATGTPICVTGTGFSSSGPNDLVLSKALPGASTTVYPLTDVSYVSPTEVTADAPASPDPTSTATIAYEVFPAIGGVYGFDHGPATFSYVVPPVVTGAAPAALASGGGQTVTVHGLHLAGVTSVVFGSTPAESIDFASDTGTSVQVVAPAGAGTSTLSLTTAGGTSTTRTASLHFVPEILEVAPSGEQDYYVLVGSGFTPSPTVKRNGAVLSPIWVDYQSANEIVLYLPDGAPTGTTFRVTSVGGTSALFTQP